MAEPLETSFYTSDEDLQHRKLLSSQDIMNDEPPGSANALLNAHWNRLRRADCLPRARDLLTGEYRLVEPDEHLSVIDVSDPNPSNFRVERNWQAPIPNIEKPLEQIFAGDNPYFMQAKALISDYLSAREGRAPVYHEIEQIVSGVFLHYRRLILPVVDEDDHVTRLLVSVRMVRPPHEKPAAEAAF